MALGGNYDAITGKPSSNGIYMTHKQSFPLIVVHLILVEWLVFVSCLLVCIYIV